MLDSMPSSLASGYALDWLLYAILHSRTQPVYLPKLASTVARLVIACSIGASRLAALPNRIDAVYARNRGSKTTASATVFRIWAGDHPHASSSRTPRRLV